MSKQDQEDRQKVALYARVSTDNQYIEGQIEKLKEWADYEDVEYEIYQDDGVSAIADNRPAFQSMMTQIENYDAVAITKLDRLGRSVNDLSTWAHDLEEKGIDLTVTDQSIDTSTKEGKFLFDILSAVAELERKLTRERMREGFKQAKENGKVGRPKMQLNVDRMVELYEQGATITALADTFGVSRNTVYDRLREQDLITEEDDKNDT